MAVRLACVAVLWLAACVGQASDGAPPSPATPRPQDKVRDPDPTAPAAPVAASPPATDGCRPVLHARLRRLSTEEYLNSLADLFPQLPRPTIDLADSDDGQHAPVDAASLEQLLRVADQVATAARPTLETFAPCDHRSRGDDACATEFVTRFGRRAWRRPLTAPEVKRFVDFARTVTAASDHSTGLAALVQAFLTSPHFLYRSELSAGAAPGVARLTAHELAANLAYTLTGGPPDAALAALADSGQIEAPATLEKTARTLITSPRGRERARALIARWVHLEGDAPLMKDKTLFPAWSADIQRLMRREFDRLVDAVLFEEDGRLDTLLTAPYTFADAALARFYRLPAVVSKDLIRVPVAAHGRGGLLTTGLFLATNAHADETDPVRRGKAVIERLLCRELSPPPDALQVSPPSPDPGATTRERWAQLTAAPNCQGCHALINPVGFGFEGFDAVGVRRTTENGRPVDTTGTLQLAGSADGPFADAVELGRKLANSDVAQRCFVERITRSVLGAADLCAPTMAFQQAGRDVRELLVTLVTSPAFTTRTR